MSDLLIKGMEMPEDGVYWCEIGVADDIAMITIHGEDRKSFPLIPIPEPHGDLIGREWLIDIAHHLMNTAKNDDVANGVKWLWQYIIEAPTIIPAEAGE